MNFAKFKNTFFSEHLWTTAFESFAFGKKLDILDITGDFTNRGKQCSTADSAKLIFHVRTDL